MVNPRQWLGVQWACLLLGVPSFPELEARPEEAQEPSWGTAKGRDTLTTLRRRREPLLHVARPCSTCYWSWGRAGHGGARQQGCQVDDHVPRSPSNTKPKSKLQ